MWTSVPQIDETATRMRTSSARRLGTATDLTSVLFGAALSFTAAFIIDVIQKFPRADSLMVPGYFNFLFRCGGTVAHPWIGWSFDVRYPTMTKRYSRGTNACASAGSPVMTQTTRAAAS